MFTSSLALLSVFIIHPTVAPIPPCSPLTFINKLVESDEAAWLLRDLPGHPVPPCPYPDPSQATLDERSVLYFFLSNPQRILNELRREGDFWSQRGLARANERLWSLYDNRPYDAGEFGNGFYPGGRIEHPEYGPDGRGIISESPNTFRAFRDLSTSNAEQPESYPQITPI